MDESSESFRLEGWGYVISLLNNLMGNFPIEDIFYDEKMQKLKFFDMCQEIQRGAGILKLFKFIYFGTGYLSLTKKKKLNRLQVLSRDSVTVSVEAVVYYRVSNPTMAVSNNHHITSVLKLCKDARMRYINKPEMDLFNEPS